MKLVRFLFQIITLGLFVYQMTYAMIKYMEFNTIPQTGYKDIADTKQPDIFMC